MLEQSLLKKQFLGRDGFHWWIGQVVASKEWRENMPALPAGSQSDLPGFKRRYKVRIMGYHTASTEVLPDVDLPWAYVMMPVTAGGSMGGMSSSVNLSGGEFVFGFYLDGEDSQQPIIMGVFDKSSQLNFGNDIPSIGFTPFQGYTNGTIVSQFDQQKGGAPKELDPVAIPKDVGEGGVKEAPKKPTQTAALEASGSTPGNDVDDEGRNAAFENAEITGEVKNANKCADDNPGEGIALVMRRLQKMQQFIDTQEGQALDKLNKVKGSLEREMNRASMAISGYVKDIMAKVRGIALKQLSDISAQISPLLPIDQMNKFKDTLDKSLESLGCVFEKVVGGLTSSMGGMLEDLKNKVTNTVDCLIDNITGSILDGALGAVNDVMGGVTSAMNGIFDSISGTIGGVADAAQSAIGAITLPLAEAANFLSTLKQLFSCEDDSECGEVKQTSFTNGNLFEKASDFASLVEGGVSKAQNLIGTAQNVGNAVTGVVDSISDGVGGITDGVTGAIDTITGTVDNVVDRVNGFPTELGNAALSCLPFAGLNLPPFVRIFGGGRGAYNDIPVDYNVVVNRQKKIIAVDPGRSNRNTDILRNATVRPGTLRRDTLIGSIVIPISEEDIDTPQRGDLVTGKGIQQDTLVEIVNRQNRTITISKPTIFTITPDEVLEFSSSSSTWGPTVYPTKPHVNIPNNVGIGGHVKVEMNPDRTIKNIYVSKQGLNYLARPDGSIGGDGKVYARADQTVVRAPNGEFRVFDPNTAIVVPSESCIYLPQGGCVTFPEGTVDELGNDVSGYQCGRGLTLGSSFCVKQQHGMITPIPEEQVEPDIDTFPVVLEMGDIIAERSGVSYTQGDTVTISGDEQEITYPLILGTNGEVIAVNVPDDERGLGFTDVPDITINTQTGAGARLLPTLRVKYRGEDNIELALSRVTPDKIISVVDCVGKNNVS